MAEDFRHRLFREVERTRATEDPGWNENRTGQREEVFAARREITIFNLTLVNMTELKDLAQIFTVVSVGLADKFLDPMDHDYDNIDQSEITARVQKFIYDVAAQVRNIHEIPPEQNETFRVILQSLQDRLLRQLSKKS